MVQYGTQSEPFEKALGDLNNDSHVDAVVVNFVSSTMSIFRGYGNGTCADNGSATSRRMCRILFPFCQIAYLYVDAEWIRSSVSMTALCVLRL